MSPDPAVESLARASERVRRVVTRIWDELEQELGLTRTQAQVLEAVGDGRRQVSAVADACGRHVSSASRLVDALVNRGLVRRVEDPDDRRAVRLTLTTEGRRTAERIQVARGAFLTQVVGHMAPGDVADLTRALEGFAAAAEASLAESCDTA